MRKLFALVLALAMLLTAAYAVAEGEEQVGQYVVYNVTGEKVTELYLTDNVTGEKTENLAGEGLEAGASLDVEYKIPGGEDGHGRLTLDFVTESGYTGTFATLSIEVAPISLLSAEAMTGATQISFFAPDQVGKYVVYNVTGEKVTELYLTDNVTGEKTENLAGEGLEAGASLDVEYKIPGGEDGHGRLTLDFVTESGYTGTFATLSIEVAPISLLSAEAMTGATQISFKAPDQVGKYVVYNVTGEKVTELYLTDNVSGEKTENLVGEGLEAGASIDVEYTLAGGEDGHGRLTLDFVTESGYTGTFATLSIEVAPISLLSAEAMTGATQISFTAPAE